MFTNKTKKSFYHLTHGHNVSALTVSESDTSYKIQTELSKLLTNYSTVQSQNTVTTYMFKLDLRQKPDFLTSSLTIINIISLKCAILWGRKNNMKNSHELEKRSKNSAVTANETHNV